LPSKSKDMAEAAAARAKLRELRDTVQDRRGEYTSVSSCGISGVINQANDMHGVTSKDTRASALDASLISTLAGLGAEQAGNLEKVSPEEWVSRLGAVFGIGSSSDGGPPKRINWKKLGVEVHEHGFNSSAPGVLFLLGAYAGPVEKKKAERKQKDRGPSGPVETAETVDVAQLQEQQEDKAQVSRIKALMATLQRTAAAAKAAGRPERVNAFELLLHPTSFSQTVENFFDLAFQVKEGVVQLQTDAECAYVSPHAAAITEDYNGGVVKVQNIMKLDYGTYRGLVDKWSQGRACLVPDRDARQDDGDEVAPAAQRRRTS